MDRETPHTTAADGPRPVLTEVDTSKYIGLSRAWLRQARMYGRGPRYIKVGRSVRYRVSDLDEWLERHLVSTSDAR